MYEMLLALAIVASPPGSPLPPDAILVHMRPAFSTTAKLLEIGDYWGGCGSEGITEQDEVESLRKRYVECLDYPPLKDTKLFAEGVDYCINARYVLYQRKAWIEQAKCIGLVNESGATLMIDDLQLRFSAWDCLCDAQRDNFNSYCRRIWLSRLKEIIGDEAYYNGRMPSPVP